MPAPWVSTLLSSEIVPLKKRQKTERKESALFPRSAPAMPRFGPGPGPACSLGSAAGCWSPTCAPGAPGAGVRVFAKFEPRRAAVRIDSPR